MGSVIVRKELVGASVNLGGAPIDLTDYATTGLRMVAIGPSGSGKTNAGLLVCEQLVAQGWVAVMVDPEGEIASLYGEAVKSPEDLTEAIMNRSKPFIVVEARDPSEFVAYGRAIMRACDAKREPVIVMMDEGQLFSASRKRKNDVGEASDLVNDFAERGRKRALDLFVTTHRYTNSLNRSVYGNKNLTLVGVQEDPLVWSALAPQFRSHHIAYADLAALSTGEFFCFSRRGLDKFRLPLSKAMSKVALPARAVRQSLPTNFSQWDRAMSAMPTKQLEGLTEPVIHLLATLSGLTMAQIAAGRRALEDERAAR